MKKKKHYKKFIIVIFFMLLIIGTYVNVIKKERSLTIFEKAIKDSVYIIENIITYPIDYIKDKIKENKEKNNIYNNYKELVTKVNNIESYEYENKELKKQINDLKNILELNNIVSNYTKVNATVIKRDFDTFNTLVIDKGTNNGIVENSLVIEKEGLIGKVISTSYYTSTIRLLTSNNSLDKISVKIENGDEYAYGLLNGYNSKNNTYKIEGVKSNVKVGSIVTTTGMGNTYPAGIVIGKVSGISTDSFDLANIIEVESLVDFNNINYVTVAIKELI